MPSRLTAGLAWVALLAPGYLPCSAAPDASLAASWRQRIAESAFVREGLSRLHSPHYQYDSIGLGGTVLRCGPHGFTSPPAPWAPVSAGYIQHMPTLTYQYWWDEDAHRLTPFDLVGGYRPENAPGEIVAFRHHLDIATGVLTIGLTLRLPTPEGAAEFTSQRTLFVTPQGVLVVRVADSREAPWPFALRVFTRAHEGWAPTPSPLPGGFLVEARRERSCVATLAVVSDPPAGTTGEGETCLTARAPGEPLTLFIAPGSSYEPDAAPESARSLAEAARAEGLAASRERAAAWWSDFHARSAFSLPDDDLMAWLARSLYYHGVFFGETDVPPGCYGTNPAGFHGAICPEYDLTFSQLALLYTGHFAESGRVAAWVANTLPRARRNATEGVTLHETTARYSTGAKYGTLVGYDGTVLVPPTPGEGVQAYANYPSANCALMALAHADWTVDPAALSSALEVLRDVARMCAESLQERPDIAPGALLDRHAPSSLQQTANLYCLREAIRRGIAEPGWEDLARRIHMPTAPFEGCDAIVVGPGFTPHPGDGDASWLAGLWWYGTLPAADPLARPTYGMAARSRSPLYVFNRGWLGVMAAKLGDGEEAQRWARSLLEPGVTLFDDTCLGEIVWDWEDFKKTPEIAAHAALVCNLTQMLLEPDAPDSLTVFPAIPEGWRQQGVAFAGLAARGGLQVSSRLSPEAVWVRLECPGENAQTRRLRVRLPADWQTLSDPPPGAITADGWVTLPEVTVPAQGAVELSLRPRP